MTLAHPGRIGQDGDAGDALAVGAVVQIVHEVTLADIDAANVGEFRAELRAVAARASTESADALVLDLAAVRFMDSTGIAVLIGLKARLQSSGVSLELHEVGPNVARALEVLGLSARFGLGDRAQRSTSHPGRSGAAGGGR